MSNNDVEYMVVCDNLVKIYKVADIEVIALQGLDLTVEKGELMAIIGNSGSGKSTLLNILGGLDRPSAGKVFVNDMDLLKLTDKQLVKYKRETVGFVWQNNARNLIPYLTALENVELPMFLTGRAKRQRALELLDMVGLSHRKIINWSNCQAVNSSVWQLPLLWQITPAYYWLTSPPELLTQKRHQIYWMFSEISIRLWE